MATQFLKVPVHRNADDNQANEKQQILRNRDEENRIHRGSDIGLIVYAWCSSSANHVLWAVISDPDID